ncbi:MAG: hypothetical protein ABI822_05760 [Bryobacteraceae bacterium]
MDSRNVEASQFPPPLKWSRFGLLLRLATAGDITSRPLWNLWPQFPRRGVAAASVALVAAALWLHFSSVAPVSANDLLSRAETSEIKAAQGVNNPVLYRKIDFRFRSSSRQAGQAGAIESWTGLKLLPAHHRSSAPFWPQFESVLRRNRMGGHPLLSAAAFAEWRNSLPGRRDNVSRGKWRDGREAITLRTVAHGLTGPGTILESTLMVRVEDWRTVQQSVRVQGEADIQEYELAEISAVVTPMSSLDASIFGTPRTEVPSRPAAPLSSTVPARLPANGSADTEIQVRYLLHRIRACLGEDIAVASNSSGRVSVDGIVESSARKEELLAALSQIATLEMRIRTFDELRPAASPVPRALALRTPAGAPAVESSVPPIERALKGRVSGSRILELSNSAVSLSESWMAESWALRRLESGFSAEKVDKLSGAGRKMLAEMVRDHASAILAGVSASEAEFRPYAAPEAVTSQESNANAAAWPVSVRSLFDAATGAAGLVRALCTGSGPSADAPADPIRTLDTALLEARAAAVRVRDNADTIPRPVTAPK